MGMAPMYTIALPHNVVVGVYSSGTALPPDRTVGPARASVWLRFDDRGPDGWWRPEGTSGFKVKQQLEHAEDVIDVCLLCDMWEAESGPDR